jgi:PAS domain S-box-containing protein
VDRELRILILEDTPADADLLEKALLASMSCLCLPVKTKEAFLKALRESPPDVIVADYSHPSLNDISALKLTLNQSPPVPFILLLETLDEAIVIQCIKSGVTDYVPKNHLAGLAPAVQRALEKRRAEVSLKESEERYRRITEAITDYVYTVKVRNGQPYQTIHGIACEAVTGFTTEEFAANPNLWIEMVYETDRSAVLKHAEKILTGAKTSPLEHRIVRKDGTIRWVKNTAVPHFDDQGKLRAYDGVIRDITERRLAEEARQKMEVQLQQAQKMEAIGTLAGGIAHDFNNILGAIIGYTELAQLDAREGTKQKINLDQVLKAARRAKDLVYQILTFSRQREHELKPTQVSLVIREALKLLRASLPTTVEIKHDLRTDALVLADPTQIHQVLMNLCTNAAHAMREDGGVLGVSLRLVGHQEKFPHQYADLQQGQYALLTVQDTGHGMTPEILERIFDPFFTTKGKSEGTGMGLSVVHGIVRSHGGRVYARSKPGKGSTFEVFLPTIDRKIEPQVMVQRPLPRGMESILFVDDEEALVDIGKRLLEALGYEVTTSTDSLQAQRLFEESPNQFDLVITDMTMPGMTGAALAKALMAIREDIPVILVTGFSNLITEDNAAGMGISAFIVKPLLIQDLAKTVRKVLDDNNFRD